MLKTGGNIILIHPCSNSIDHGFYSFSPTLYFDYFKGNSFSNMSCYLREGSPYVYERKSKLYKYKHIDKEIPMLSGKSIETAFFATKNSSDCGQHPKKPIQFVYRKHDSWNNDNNTSPLSIKPTLKWKIKAIIKQLFFYFRFLPFPIEKFIFSRSRGKNIELIGKY